MLMRHPVQRLPEEAEVPHAHSLRDLIVGLQALLQARLHKLEVPWDLPQKQAHQHQPLCGCRPEPNGAGGRLQSGRTAGGTACASRAAGETRRQHGDAITCSSSVWCCNGRRALSRLHVKTRGMASCMTAEVPNIAAAACQPASPWTSPTLAALPTTKQDTDFLIVQAAISTPPRQMDVSRQSHLASCLLEAVLGICVVQRDGPDATQVVQVAAQLCVLPALLGALRLGPQLLCLQQAGDATLPSALYQAEGDDAQAGLDHDRARPHGRLPAPRTATTGDASEGRC